jgi:5'-nucleotidase (lipoprotein e(P4) family)
VAALRVLLILFGTQACSGLGPQASVAQSPTSHLGVKYVRDSEEYAALSRQVYRLAGRAVQQAAKRGTWAVVLDIDETTLDNSTYELENAAYHRSFGSASWDAWVRRVEAGTVPGVAEFVAGVRRQGGRIAWISNRSDSTREATRANLERAGLWHAADRLCLETDTAYTKRVRRAELMAGSGRCGWSNEPVSVVAYVGDQMSDFPGGGEQDPDAGPSDAAFGTRFFLLPNPMYGRWTTRVTRR